MGALPPGYRVGAAFRRVELISCCWPRLRLRLRVAACCRECTSMRPRAMTSQLRLPAFSLGACLLLHKTVKQPSLLGGLCRPCCGAAGHHRPLLPAPAAAPRPAASSSPRHHGAPPLLAPGRPLLGGARLALLAALLAALVSRSPERHVWAPVLLLGEHHHLRPGQAGRQAGRKCALGHRCTQGSAPGARKHRRCNSCCTSAAGGVASQHSPTPGPSPSGRPGWWWSPWARPPRRSRGRPTTDPGAARGRRAPSACCARAAPSGPPCGGGGGGGRQQGLEHVGGGAGAGAGCLCMAGRGARGLRSRAAQHGQRRRRTARCAAGR
jgi:hypothetical protein